MRNACWIDDWTGDRFTMNHVCYPWLWMAYEPPEVYFLARTTQATTRCPSCQSDMQRMNTYGGIARCPECGQHWMLTGSFGRACMVIRPVTADTYTLAVGQFFERQARLAIVALPAPTPQ